MPRRIIRNRLLYLVTERERKEGKLIREARLARELNLARPTIHAWLNNEVTKFETGVVATICDYFQCDLCDLLYFETVEDET